MPLSLPSTLPLLCHILLKIIIDDTAVVHNCTNEFASVSNIYLLLISTLWLCSCVSSHFSLIRWDIESQHNSSIYTCKWALFVVYVWVMCVCVSWKLAIGNGQGNVSSIVPSGECGRCRHIKICDTNGSLWIGNCVPFSDFGYVKRVCVTCQLSAVRVWTIFVCH